MRIENLEIIWGINRQKLKKNADACRIWPLLVIIPNIIVSNALTKAQAIQYKDNTVFVISEEQYLRLINT